MNNQINNLELNIFVWGSNFRLGHLSSCILFQNFISYLFQNLMINANFQNFPHLSVVSDFWNTYLEGVLRDGAYAQVGLAYLGDLDLACREEVAFLEEACQGEAYLDPSSLGAASVVAYQVGLKILQGRLSGKNVLITVVVGGGIQIRKFCSQQII